MVTRRPVTRKPIKIRKPIHKDFCSCYGVKVLSVEGVPHLVIADGLSTESIEKYLDSVNVTTGVFFSEPIEDCEDKIQAVLDRNVPVTIQTKKELPLHILESLSKVPHSAIHSAINFLDGSIRTSLESDFSETSALRRMLSLAKSQKIFIGLRVDYMPHLVSRLDLYEIIDSVQQYASHIMLSFPHIADELFYDSKHRWEALKPSSIEKFKQYYEPYVPGRTWHLRDKYKADIVEGVGEYLKHRKISFDVVDYDWGYDRIRHQTTGLSDLVLGINPFIYQKDTNDEFMKLKHTKNVQEDPCSNCGKTLFT